MGQSAFNLVMCNSPLLLYKAKFERMKSSRYYESICSTTCYVCLYENNFLPTSQSITLNKVKQTCVEYVSVPNIAPVDAIPCVNLLFQTLNEPHLIYFFMHTKQQVMCL